jgi:hypothetical protein
LFQRACACSFFPGARSSYALACLICGKGEGAFRILSRYAVRVQR